METKSFLRVALAVAVCECAGIVGLVFAYPSIPTWYASLQKPWFNPPNWLFAPVWLILFALMGIAAGLIWNKGLESEKVKMASFVFGVQLVLNVLWSIVFFRAHLLLSSLVVIVALWIAIAVAMVAFFRISRRTGLLLAPYICWVSLAAILNLYIWLLNP